MCKVMNVQKSWLVCTNLIKNNIFFIIYIFLICNPLKSLGKLVDMLKNIGYILPKVLCLLYPIYGVYMKKINLHLWCIYE